MGDDTMIVEVPDPDCMSDSPWRERVLPVREAVAKRLKPTGTWKTADDSAVTLVGVGFFDKLHGQRGLAPNGIELHPVLDICWGKGCALGSRW